MSSVTKAKSVTSSKLSLLFYRNTNPYITDDKGNIQTEQQVINNQVVQVNKVDKSTWTNNIKVCFRISDPEADIVVPPSMSVDFIKSMLAEKKQAKQAFSALPKTIYYLVDKSVKYGQVEGKDVIFCTYKPHSAKFVSALSL